MNCEFFNIHGIQMTLIFTDIFVYNTQSAKTFKPANSYNYRIAKFLISRYLLSPRRSVAFLLMNGASQPKPNQSTTAGSKIKK